MRKNLFAGLSPIASFFFTLSLLVVGASAIQAAVYAEMPVDGTLLSVPTKGQAVVRLDAVPGMLPAQTVRAVIRDTIGDPDRIGVHAGAHFGALYAPAAHALHALTIEPAYTAGLPDAHVRGDLAIGQTVPNLRFVDQTGTPVALNDFRGKVVLLSFFYTRCPDKNICPAISGRYAYLQSHIDPATTALLEVTLDPRYDSPATLAAYGSRYGADAASWHLVTGESNTISDALALFGLSNLQSQPGNFIHDDVLAFIGRDGKIAQLVTTVGWSPDDVLATVASMNGLPSNPIQRIKLEAVARLVSACGGSTTAAVAIMDSVIFVLGVLIFGGILYWFGRKIWSDPA